MDIGVIGMGVMGRNLAMNLRDQGYKVSVYNRTLSKMDLIDGVTKCKSIEEFVKSLACPRKILLMVSDNVVEKMVTELRSFVNADDLIVDCGNSHYRQCTRLGIDGCGVSGGEEGARWGPSMMYGGRRENWEILKPILRKAAAKVKGTDIVCCEFMGEGGAGHFVKMVHNGIEYGLMQILGEIYSLGGSLELLNKHTNSYLLEISEKILRHPERLEEVTDYVSQKGTGIWCLQEAAEKYPCPILAAAVFFRKISCLPARKLFQQKYPPVRLNERANDETIINAYELAAILAYLEGLMLIKSHLSDLNMNIVLQTWRAGCIIRSDLIDILKEITDLQSDSFLQIVHKNLQSLRDLVIFGVKNGIAIPGLSAALQFIESMRSTQCASLMALMRDFFGSHGVQMKDGTSKHYDWQ